jgi:hypothetical protein
MPLCCDLFIHRFFHRLLENSRQATTSEGKIRTIAAGMSFGTSMMDFGDHISRSNI